jgi:hypothetical protein
MALTLAEERTRLAWRRTVMAAAAVTLLAARPALSPGAGPVQIAVAAAALGGWAVLVVLAYRRRRGRDDYALLAWAAAVLGYAALGLLLLVG